MKTSINCPDCNAPIPVESTLLLAGQKFDCPNPHCGTSISLSPADTEKVATAINEFKNLKENALQQSRQNELM